MIGSKKWPVGKAEGSANSPKGKILIKDERKDMSERKQQKHQEQSAACEVENRTEIDIEEVENKATGESAKAGEVNADEAMSGDESESLKAELEEKTKQCAEYLEKLQRAAAEFDNFKKRTVKEKEALYADAVCDVICAFLPVLDNIERALAAITEDSSAQSLKDGVEMVFKQFWDVLKSIGVEQIAALNEQFDPMLHNAVMHVEDETVGHNVIVEEFQKGYIYQDKVIRYSMVKVAN